MSGEPGDNVVKLREEDGHIAAFLEGLKGGGGGGTSGGMDSDVVDAKISASEARTDTKFAELRGDLRSFATKATVWQAAATIAAVILAVLAFGGDRFDSGMDAAGIAEKIQSAQHEVDTRQDGKLDAMDRKLDYLVAQVRADQAHDRAQAK